MAVLLKNMTIQGIPVLCCQGDTDFPKPLILLSHGISGSKTDWQEKLIQLAESGYYAVAFDNRLHGERVVAGVQSAAFADGKFGLSPLLAVIETADDVKLLIDHFSATDDIQPERIGMAGFSMGGFITYRALVIDKRIRAAAPMLATPCWDEVPENLPDEIRRRLQAYSAHYSPANMLAKFYPTAILIQNGEEDTLFDRMRVKKFAESLLPYYQDDPERLQCVFYPNVGHEFTDTMWENVLAWFRKYV